MPSKRRQFMRALGIGAAGTIAGCSSDDDPDNGMPADGLVEGSELDEYEQIEVTANSHARSSFPLRVEYAQMAEDRWREDVGLDVTHNPTEQAYEMANARDYDIYITGGWGGRPERIDPDTYITAFQTGEPGGLNNTGFSNDEYDELADSQRAETDREQRQEQVYRAQEIVAEQQPVIFMFARDALSATNMDNWDNYTAQIGARPYTHVWNLQSMEPQNEQGNTAVLAATRDADTTNPMGVSQTQGTHLNKLIYDRLVRHDPAGNPQPWAAAEWDAVDATTFDVTLREGMTFHDGEPVRPEDVKFTIEYMQEWEVPYLASFYRPIESVELQGDNGVRFNLSEAYVPFVNISLTQLGIIPEHIWDGVVEEHDLDHPRQWNDFDPVGSGPFELEFFETENRAELSVFDDHFSDYNIERFVWRMYGGNSAAMGSVEQGDSSYMEYIQPTQYERAQDTDNLEATEASYHGWSYMGLNNERRPFSDREFRVALSHLVNKPEMREVVFNGRAEALKGPIPSAAEYWYNPDLPEYNGGKEEAQQILLDAGYRWDPDGNLLMPLED